MVVDAVVAEHFVQEVSEAWHENQSLNIFVNIANVIAIVQFAVMLVGFYLAYRTYFVIVAEPKNNSKMLKIILNK